MIGAVAVSRTLALLVGCAAVILACSGAPKEDDAARAAAEPIADVAYASLTGDAAKGKIVFIQCATCHSINQSEIRTGPSLHASIEKKAGVMAGFAYSTAMKNSGLVWSEDELYRYLEAPQRSVPGTKMSFGGLRKPQDRADVIAYLKTI